MINLFDAYELRARLFPALIILSPLIMPIIPLLILTEVKVTEAIYIVAIFFALCYMISMAARFSSKEKVKQLIKEWGTLPSTLLMLNKNTVFHTATKDKLRKKIEADYGIQLIPDSDTEEQDIYKSFLFIKARLRDEKGLTFKHNCEYGFLRNLYGGYNWWLYVGIFSTLLSGGLLIYEQSILHFLTVFFSIIFILLIIASNRKVLKNSIKKAAFIYAETAWTEYYHLKNIEHGI